MQNVVIATEKQILEGREQDRKKISMKEVPYQSKENE